MHTHTQRVYRSHKVTTQSHTIKRNEGAAFNLEIIFVHELSINIEIHFIMAT